MPEPYSETQKRLTRESVLTALLRLLESKAFHDLTVTEITKLAGVSRPAFYRNYATREDILTFHLDELFQELLQQLAAPENREKRIRTMLCFSFFKKHRKFIEVLIRADLTPVFHKRFCVHVADFFRLHTNKFSQSTLLEKYLPQFVSSGLSRVLLEWVDGGLVESVEEMTELMGRLTGWGPEVMQ